VVLGGEGGECFPQLDWIGVQADLAAGGQRVEHPAGIRAGADGQGQVGVLGVGHRLPGLVGAGEAVHLVKGHVRGRVDPAHGEVQYPAAADGGELVTITEQSHPHVVLVGDGEQGSGGVLVEHAGLVDDQQVPRSEVGSDPRAGVWNAADRVGLAGGEPGPGAVVGPAPAVLEGQPGRRAGGGADLGGGDAGRLQGGVTTTSRRPRSSSSRRAVARVVVLPAPAAPSTTTSGRFPASAAAVAA
jgi:hypothetical protein